MLGLFQTRERRAQDIRIKALEFATQHREWSHQTAASLIEDAATVEAFICGLRVPTPAAMTSDTADRQALS